MNELMKPSSGLFQETVLDIPHKYYLAFVACNSKPSSSFYRLKDKILKVFGHENDYDLQHIKKKCHTCNGTGMFYQNVRCRRCFNGVYQAYDVVLKRYILNGGCFHIPLGRLENNKLKIFDGVVYESEYDDYGFTKWRYEPFEGVFKNTITGLIKHSEKTDINTSWAYWYLLHKYDHPAFLQETTAFLNAKWNKDEFQRRNYLWLTCDHGLIALAKYYNCEEQAAILLKPEPATESEYNKYLKSK